MENTNFQNKRKAYKEWTIKNEHADRRLIIKYNGKFAGCVVKYQRKI